MFVFDEVNCLSGGAAIEATGGLAGLYPTPPLTTDGGTTPPS